MGLAVQTSRCDIESVWRLLALTDAELESTDLVAINLIAAREISCFQSLDIRRYCDTVNDWTRAFARWLPSADQAFHRTPWKWKSDIRFFRIGMLAGFLGYEIGIRYIEEQKHAEAVCYTDPGQLFLNGLIDTKKGTCGDMAALQVAMSRKMGWAVSLACVKSHFISRYDDGEVVYNLESTQTDHPGTFSSDTDKWYTKKYALPKKAIDCGSDLRRLAAREMIGAFVGLRGRHYLDTNDCYRADRSYALARVLFPQHRRASVGAMMPMLKRGETLAEPDEVGHPRALFHEDLLAMFAPDLRPSKNWQRAPDDKIQKQPVTSPVLAPLYSPFGRSVINTSSTEWKV